jgi:iron(II)-dependent oxidoreductase
MALTLFSRKAGRHQKSHTNQKGSGSTAMENYEPAGAITLDNDPLRRQMQLERFGFVVRQKHEWRDHPMVESVFQNAVEAIDDRFVLVPEGFVSLSAAVSDFPGAPEVDYETDPFLLARHCITQAQYQLFVDSGGYEDLELWPEDIWPHLIDFKDLTGHPGPRFWREGRHDQRLGDHPVVGISFYEAAAYARWAGYRLPAGPEWQMAASWRIRSSAHVLRRYPWGDALDVEKCNIWSSGVGMTTPVDAYPQGAAPNGVLQLIGNVWEWTTTDYEVTDDAGRHVLGDMLLKEIRGGAYDTYFPAQATSCFRTGAPSLNRTHNIGFRCVLDLEKSDSTSAE